MKQTYNDQSALILLSGGQDSCTCLFWALKNFKEVHAISFNYGQRHLKEIKIAEKICKKLNISQKILDISFLSNLRIYPSSVTTITSSSKDEILHPKLEAFITTRPPINAGIPTKLSKPLRFSLTE